MKRSFYPPSVFNVQAPVSVRSRFLIGLLVSAGCVLGGGVSLGGAQEPTHGFPEGAAYHASGIARVIGSDRVRLTLACPAGSVPCRGRVSLTTRSRVRIRAGGPLARVIVIRGSYGEIAPGERAQVTLPLRRAARYHVLRHRDTPTLIAIRNEVEAPAPFLSNRVVVRAPA